MECRAGESERNWFRSDRVYSMSGQWYFTTREKEEIGPFPNRQAAQAEVERFLHCMREEGILAAHYYTTMRRKMGMGRASP